MLQVCYMYIINICMFVYHFEGNMTFPAVMPVHMRSHEVAFTAVGATLATPLHLAILDVVEFECGQFLLNVSMFIFLFRRVHFLLLLSPIQP